jgi:hypothetical protein
MEIHNIYVQKRNKSLNADTLLRHYYKNELHHGLAKQIYRVGVGHCLLQMVSNPLHYAGPEIRHVSCLANSDLHGRYDASCSI